MLHAKMLCYASCDVGFYTVTYVAWHMRHAKYVVSCRVVSRRVMWVHLKCVEMGTLDCGMSIFNSNIIHSYRRGEITLIVFS